MIASFISSDTFEAFISVFNVIILVMSFSFAYLSTVNSETSLTCLEFCDMTNNCAASSHQEMVILNTGHKGMALANRNTRLGCDT